VRKILLPGTGIETSVLGMGCASLGSRIPAAHGRRMLDSAFERGVTWYDVAPSYGAGQAEDILAPFLASRRDRVFVCSKVGLAPPRHNGTMRLAYALGRPMLGLAQGLRKRFRAIKATRNVRIPLTPDLIETSIEATLRRLGTDHLDVFALHDPDPADLARDEVLTALEKLKTRGLTRYISVAGTEEAARKAAALPLFTVMQLADDPEDQPLVGLRAMLNRPVTFVTHSVFGVDGARARMVRRLEADARLREDLASSGYEGTPQKVATALLLRRAFASNPDGVVLASMFSNAHLAENAALARLVVDYQPVRLSERVFAPSTPSAGKTATGATELVP
jgi:aryl-alcohol dehydrogenase-like predicted oxidoreductase